MHQAPSAGGRDDAAFGIVSGDCLCSNWLGYNTYLFHYSYLKKKEWNEQMWQPSLHLSFPALQHLAVSISQHEIQSKGYKNSCADLPLELWLTTSTYILLLCQIFWMIIMCIFTILMHGEQTFLLISMGLFPNISLIPVDNPLCIKRACTSHPGLSKSEYCVFLNQYVLWYL